MTLCYCRLEGHQIGPVTLARLCQMAKQGEITLAHEIRVGTDGDWVSVAEIDDLRKILKPEPESEAPVGPIVITSRAPSAIEYLLETVGDGIRERWTAVKQAAPSILWLARQILAVSVILAVSGYGIFAVVRNLPVKIADPQATYESLWQELKAKRDAKVSDGEWQQFQTRVRSELAPILAHLEQSAGAEDRISQLLLWAGRDGLLKMLEDARTKVSPSELTFQEHLLNVSRLKKGEILYVSSRRRRYRPPPPWYTTFFSSDMATILIVGVDVVVVLGFATIWLRTKKKTKA